MMRGMKLAMLLIALLAPATWADTDGLDDKALADQSVAELRAGITDKHPATYMVLAARLFQQGDKPEAVKWFYVGQIRYRAFLKANPDLDPSGDPALFASLMESVGRPLNEYIGGDVDQWVATIDDAIDWHDSHPDGFLGKDQHRALYASVIAGLKDMRDEIAASKDEIRRQRRENGLENR